MLREGSSPRRAANILHHRADDRHLDRRRRAEAHDLAHDIAGSNPNVDMPGPRCALRPASTLRSSVLVSHGMTCSGGNRRSRSRNSASPPAVLLVSADPQLAVVGPAHEQDHVVDAEVRRAWPT